MYIGHVRKSSLLICTGDSEDVKVEWLPQIEYCGYKTFAELRYSLPVELVETVHLFIVLCRIEELFDILVEFPDSEPALLDLKECLKRVELRTFLINSLRAV